MFGDRCLAYALEIEARARGFEVTNYGAFLAEHEPEFEVEIKQGAEGEGTAWSCAHGLGRWTRDCSCHAGAPVGWNQTWRAPLRRALDYLRDEAAAHFEEDGGRLFRDPWETRDAYIELILDPRRSPEQFLRRFRARGLRQPEQDRAVALLELQRSSMVMYTSCGWFFNDIAGLEAVQVLRYAGRVLGLMDGLGFPSAYEGFLELLSEAKSNQPTYGTGADVFRCHVEPRLVAVSPHVSTACGSGRVSQRR
jgi:alpha-amylase/alpha-mannosidase (GH57 family)